MEAVLGFWVLGLELGFGTRMERMIRIYADFIVMFLERRLEKFEKLEWVLVLGCRLSVVGFEQLG